MAQADHQPIVFVACRVFETLLQDHMPPELIDQITFMDYGLHRVPTKMTWTVQEAIDAIVEPSLIVLGYGLCGNGMQGIKARKHTLLIPRADDCIAILLGSYKRYIQEFEATPGTYYLTKGWLEAGSDPLKEYHEIVEKYGAEDADWIMDQQYQHYNRVCFVAHNQADLDQYRPRAKEVADFCAERWGMRYEEILGSDIYVRRLVEISADIDNADDEFLIIQPGGKISMDQFVR